MLGAYDGIALPVTKTSSVVDDGRPIADRAAPNDLPAPVPAACITLALLLLATKITPEVSACRLVRVDFQIDGLVADGGNTVSPPSA